ncbi:hypothetical protein B0H13DRAFT_1502591, partial [Mycena leptocephala]
PCGFCGRSNRAECAISIKPKGQSVEIFTTCKYGVSFQYQIADKGSATTPSQNVPVICNLCPTPPGRYPVFQADWRYNMAEHLRDLHPEYASLLQPEEDSLPYKVWESTRIDKEEEIALGVPE